MKVNPKNVVVSPRALILLDKKVPFKGLVSDADSMHLVPALVYYLEMSWHDENGDRVTTGPGYGFCRHYREAVEEHVAIQFPLINQSTRSGTLMEKENLGRRRPFGAASVLIAASVQRRTR
jgi:hypothetical protein